MYLKRKKKNFITTWWKTIDHIILSALAIILTLSAVMVAAASPAVAERIGLESFYFIKRQLIYLAIAIIIIFAISLLSIQNIKKISIIGSIICVLLLIAVLFIGVEIKGAKRWIYLGSFSIQPSEFIKPFFAVLTGLILSKRYLIDNFPAFKLATILYIILASLLILQPDFGMVVTISAVWSGQLFLAGLSIVFILAVILIAIFGFVGAYLLLPHVTKRINSFLDPQKNENYQVKKSLEAFASGGLYGRGPGEGVVKQSLPDSHTDFIFAVVAEELGMITCIIIILLFMIIILRGFNKIINEENQFITFATAGLLMQFGIQAIINMGVTLHLLPTKGMTLPFISYGGSSMIATAFGVGMILAMTRKRYGLVKVGSKGYRLWIK